MRCSRIALWNPPTSSSLAEEKRLCFLLLSTAARDSRRSQRLGVVRKLLHCPTVPVGIGEEHERPPGLGVDFAHLDSASGQLRPSLVNVADNYLEVVQRTRRQLRQSLADSNRACRAWRGQLHEADVITNRVVVVENKTRLVHVEVFGAIHIADWHTDEFESEIHDSDGIRRLRQFDAPLLPGGDRKQRN